MNAGKPRRMAAFLEDVTLEKNGDRKRADGDYATNGAEGQISDYRIQ
jgi:hypothetical protein